MTTTTTDSAVGTGTFALLEQAYKALIKAGKDSVRQAWRFGQSIDSFTDDWTMAQLADHLDLSAGTLYRYRRLYLAYQRVELALEASAQLETYNIDTIWELQNMLKPVEHGRPMAGRRYVYTCRTCHSHEIGRDEIDPETGELLEAAE